MLGTHRCRDKLGNADKKHVRRVPSARTTVQRILELERRNRELESFVHSLAHDSTALVRAIALRADMLAERLPADDQAAALLDAIAHGTRRLSSLCEALRRLARIGKRTLVRQEIDLSALALEIVGELQREAPTRRIHVDVERDLVAWGDAELVRLVLHNLLSNAWKYTANNPQARIELGLQRGEHEPVYYIADNGIGFSPEDAKSLFVPFGRLRSARSFPGSGLGLMIVKQVLERHGGWIRATGVLGRGAKFTFSLGAASAGSTI